MFKEVKVTMLVMENPYYLLPTAASTNLTVIYCCVTKHRELSGLKHLLLYSCELGSSAGLSCAHLLQALSAHTFVVSTRVGSGPTELRWLSWKTVLCICMASHSPGYPGLVQMMVVVKVLRAKAE